MGWVGMGWDGTTGLRVESVRTRRVGLLWESVRPPVGRLSFPPPRLTLSVRTALRLQLRPRRIVLQVVVNRVVRFIHDIEHAALDEDRQHALALFCGRQAVD